MQGLGIIGTDNKAILADFNMVSDSGCLDHAPSANMNMVAYLHGIVVEVSSISFIRWSEQTSRTQISGVASAWCAQKRRTA